MPLIPALWRQRQVDLCEVKASLVYRASARTGSKATGKSCLKQTNQTISSSLYLLRGLKGSKSYQSRKGNKHKDRAEKNLGCKCGKLRTADTVVVCILPS